MMVKNKISSAVAGIVLAGSMFSTNASAAQLLNWQLDTSGIGGSNQTGINNLSFNGASYIDTNANAGDPIGTAFTFTDKGVFNVGQYNNGSFFSWVGTNELTANFSATGTGTLGGAFSFNAGGTLDLYFASGADKDYGANSNTYGTTNGALIASFTQLAGGGGLVNPDGTPTANGQITLLYQSTFLDQNVWKNSLGTSLPILLTLGFVTSNAANLPNPDANLQAALGGNAGSLPPDYFYVTNGGQFKLETVPEPATLALIGVGLLGASFRRRVA
ncbi:flocculation-associated PEP-CTERM protein PepA [Methylomonas methanica]|jgi:hypothetical protein|uniref:Ice-binding protein C-terminal domain-containing protein n=1 Tax=Methylomonas methanica TaxID=421 RepID=A0A177LYB8_METMH|nr:flocculation-associated PEP-CTERM protein PepA [Methylomonas methanica]OAH98350.1 hypothetical protein A1332_20365 [Methylomonas methanica]